MVFSFKLNASIPAGDESIYRLALYNTLSGRPRISNFLLNKISLEKKFSDKKKLLFAYNYFIVGDYKQFSKFLSEVKGQDYSTFKKICVLKVYEELIHNSRGTPKICHKLAGKTTLFLDSLRFLKQKNNDKVQRIIDEHARKEINIDLVKTLLKSSIFTGNEEFILDYLTLFPAKVFKYASIRELLGIVFFRLRDLKKAEKIIRPVDTVNAKNILGNIEIEKGNIDIAFGYFLEAHKKDITSFNALKKLIPLTWKLGKFKLLTSLLRTFTPEDKRKQIIRSASLLKQKKYKESIQELNGNSKQRKKNTPIIDVLINLINHFNIEKDNTVFEYSKEGCKRNNSIACDILFYMSEVKSTRYIKSILTASHSYKDIEVEKLKSTMDVSPIVETKLINQRDIEELDDQVQFRQSVQKLSI